MGIAGNAESCAAGEDGALMETVRVMDPPNAARERFAGARTGSAIREFNSAKRTGRIPTVAGAKEGKTGPYAILVPTLESPIQVIAAGIGALIYKKSLSIAENAEMHARPVRTAKAVCVCATTPTRMLARETDALT
jgi:hypothetical protein